MVAPNRPGGCGGTDKVTIHLVLDKDINLHTFQQHDYHTFGRFTIFLRSYSSSNLNILVNFLF